MIFSYLKSSDLTTKFGKRRKMLQLFPKWGNLKILLKGKENDGLEINFATKVSLTLLVKSSC